MRAVAGGVDVNAVIHTKHSEELLAVADRMSTGASDPPSGQRPGLPVIFLACSVSFP